MKYIFDKNIENKNIDAKFYIIGPNGKAPEHLNARIKKMIENGTFSYDSPHTKAFNFENMSEIVITTGKSDGSRLLRRDNYRMAVNTAANICKNEKYSDVAFSFIELETCEKAALKFLSEMLEFNEYRFDDFKEKKDESKLEKIYLTDSIYDDSYIKYVEEGIAIAKSVNEARHLVDQPANLLFPETLAENAVKYGEEYGYEVDVKNLKEIQELGMHAFLTVAQGSDKEPKLIVMRYNGDKENSSKLGLVGKGLTYDSGGLSIKPTAGMDTMKCDMAGAATVIGTMNAIAKAGLKINVIAVVASCENMISGRSYKPGDIIPTMAGKHIYIGNTDAEGRLTLVDAIHYIITKEKVDEVIDLATLTGAALVALGNTCSASLTNNQEFLNDLQESFENSGEYNWQLPTFEYFKNHIKHSDADYTNTTSAAARSAGTILAGLLLGEFVGDKNWIHLDIAGPAFMSSDTGYYKKGATGYGVKTLFDFAKRRAIIRKEDECPL